MLDSVFEGSDLRFLGVVSPEVPEDFQRYRKWLLERRHGDMDYLEKNIECRQDPSRALSGIRSILVFALPYQQPETEGNFKIAQYARFQDYHTLLKERAAQVVEKLCAKNDLPRDAFRIVTDSVPILERAYASKTGSGFIGKNTCFIHPRFGSFLLLGEILSTHPFSVLNQVNENATCGTCTLCQVHCPTGALNTDYSIDASKCIAYWTIENRGTIPEVYWPHLEEYVFGCDLCQTVCPFNTAADNRLPKSIPVKNFPDLFETATMTQEEYREYFSGTPMTRAKKEGLVRNALIALFVKNDPRRFEALEKVRNDSHPMLQGTVAQIMAKYT